ncbi:hypothetical protein [[Clostridium] innocuum]|jgi:hypothetical protein|uniref:hypothetical protein n=1 Tax=Clostridium innocuum TaxID=1522 RepID=UPI001402433D|nr:hypothetical protein [[Clostridium] innocuum]
MLSKKEENAKEKVILALSDRIIDELKDTSLKRDESALVNLIIGFAKLLNV